MRRRGFFLLLGLLPNLAEATAADACQVLDWPALTGPEAEALATGAAAVFWNPAQTSALVGRGEVLVLDIRTPREIGLRGMAAAGAIRLTKGSFLSLGYEHLAIDGIPRTSTSPIPESPENEVVLTDDVLSLALAGLLGAHFGLGAGIRYSSTRGVAPGVAETQYDLGLVLRPDLGLPASLSIAGRQSKRGAQWLAGCELSIPEEGIRLSYGFVGGQSGWDTHRLVVTFFWPLGLELGAGAVAEAGNGTVDWQPVVGGTLDLERYFVGFVREELGWGFGATWYYRLGFRF